jgi:hypothetical protein
MEPSRLEGSVSFVAPDGHLVFALLHGQAGAPDHPRRLGKRFAKKRLMPVASVDPYFYA